MNFVQEACMAAKKQTTKSKTTVSTKMAKVSAAEKLAAARAKVVRTQANGNGKELVLALPPVKAPKFLQGFVDFIRTQGVVGLAVGLVLGVAAKSVVDSLVANIFNPIIGLLGAGGGSLEDRFVCLRDSVDAAGKVMCDNKLGYGHVLSTLVSFVTVAAVVYFVIHGLKLDKLDKKKDA
jgi:large conductance mechanosensitive channel protein